MVHDREERRRPSPSVKCKKAMHLDQVDVGWKRAGLASRRSRRCDQHLSCRLVAKTLKLRPEGMTWVESSEERVILDEASDLYLATNPTGSLLWRELSSGTTREELVKLLVTTYDIDRVRAAADVDAYVGQLEQLDLLEPMS